MLKQARSNAMIFVLLLAVAMTVLPEDALCLNDTLDFERFTRNDGLAGNTVSAVVQDSDGFLWVGTSDGLNRYDGKRFLTFRHDPQDSASLVSNSILSLAADADGNLWVGTDSGLDMYSRTSGGFRRIRIASDQMSSISDGRIYALCADGAGRIWAGTGHGLYLYEPESGRFSWFRHDPGISGSLPHDKVAALAPDGDGGMLVGTDGGIRRYDPHTDSFSRLPGEHSEALGDIRNVTSIVSGARGDVWIASWSDGLYRYSPDNGLVESFRGGGGERALTHTSVGYLAIGADGTLWAGTLHGLNAITVEGDGTVSIKRHYHDSDDPASLGSNAIWGLCVDSGGVLWIGTHRGGLHKMVPSMNVFSHYEHREGLDTSLGDNLVTDICADGSTVWFGTAFGISRFDPRDGAFRSYRPVAGLDAANEINDVCVRDSHRLWCGTNDGVWSFDRRDGVFERFSLNDGLPGSAALCLANDRIAGALWVGTDRGLRRIDTMTGEVRVPEASIADGDMLVHGTVISLIVDGTGAVWAGTGSGLYVRPPRGDAYIRHSHVPGNDATLSSDTISALYESSTGDIWVGTAEGLNRYDRANGFFDRCMASRDGGDAYVYAIGEDAGGSIWVTARDGLCRIDADDLSCEWIASAGLPFDSFSANALLGDATGEMYVGGLEGVFSFDIRDITTNTHVPPVVITGFNNYSSEGGAGALADPGEPVRLSYNDIYFSFEFAALDYANPGQNRYKCRMVGFDRDWVDNGSLTFKSYTNLDPGRYEFRVIASNNDGVWNTAGASVPVIIVPPYWEALWFKLIALAVFSVLLYVAHRFSLNAITEQRLVLSGLVQKRTKELERINRELQKLTVVDELTQIPNRRKFDEYLSFTWRVGRRNKTPLTLIIIDVDHFKAYNDTYGHPAGDVCLQSIARAMSRTVNRSNDLVARYGGEEFVVVLPDTSEEGAMIVAENLKNAVETLDIAHASSDVCGHVTVSLGVATMVPGNDNEPIGLVAKADAALYRAKNSGRNLVMTLG